MKVWKAGIIGCGNIADIYVKNIQTYFENLEIVACAAKHLESAARLAKKYGIARAATTEEILADPEIDVVLNLTVPDVHFELNLGEENKDPMIQSICEMPRAFWGKSCVDSWAIQEGKSFV